MADAISLPDRIFGYVSVRSDDRRSVLQADDLSDVKSFYGSASNKRKARARINETGLEIIAKSDLGFAVVGTTKQWEAFNEGALKSFERMLYTRTGLRQSVTHIGFGRQKADDAEDLSGRIPEDDRNTGLDLLVLERPRAALDVLSAPTPPEVDGYYLRVPDDVARLLGAPKAIRKKRPGDGVTVAMVDTGWSRHPFFDEHGYRVDPPVSAVPGADPEYDRHGHGTGESANLFAVAPGATLRPIRAADDRGHLVATLAGFMRAKEKDIGAKVITNSWGGDYPYPDVPPIPYAADRILELEIRDAVAKNIVVVFSAGNGNFTMEAQIPGVIAAGGVFVDEGGGLHATPYASGYRGKWYHRDNDRRSEWMTVPTVCGLVGLPPRGAYIMLPVPDGCQIDVERAAWGRDDPPDGTSPFDGWALFSGTSAAAPQVAGAAAVLLQKHPKATPRQISRLLCKTATDVCKGSGHPRFERRARIGPDEATGYGLVNLSEAAASRSLPPDKPAEDDGPLGGTEREKQPDEPSAPDRDKLIQFLTKLATDPSFRTRMEEDPEEALEEEGLLGAVDFEEPVRLRPMAECRAALDALLRGEPFDTVTPTRPLTSMHT
jgi:Subtilase family